MSNSDSMVTSFEDVVSRSPDAYALRWRSGVWTYAELNARANRLAHFLISVGVRAETPVGVFSLRSPETLVAFLAILKAGGAYVPLDPSYPEDRIKYYMEDAAIQFVLADPNEITLLPSTGAKVILLHKYRAEEYPDTNPECKTGPDSLAHILYTSGSTGQPKGVMVEHRGVLRLCRHIDYMDIGPGETILQYAPLSFDISTFEIWGSWLNGACVAVPPAGLTSLHDLGVALRTFKVTGVTLTASLLALMVEQEIEALAGVRQIMTGGDVVSPVYAERFLQKYPDSRLINAYGPTENSVLTTCHIIKLEDPMPARLSIGRPIQKTQVLILDENLLPVPPGEVGELVMTGEGVARGYLNKPEMTERSFVQVVDAAGNKIRAYRSGDLGRYIADGTIDFHGRRDGQVKINGLRIELGEIQNVLQSHPEVAGAEVLIAENEGRKRLLAFVVRRPGMIVDEHTLRQFLGGKVPANWQPFAISIISNLPMTPNGKVDRHALLESFASKAANRDSIQADEPADFVEKAIWNVWREILPGTRIGRHDRFAELGGDSLAALHMMARVEKSLGRTIGLRSLLEGGTIVDLAAAARASGPVTPPPLMICTQPGIATNAPFFFAHGDYVFGGLYCQRMAGKVGNDQPFYAIAPHGTFGGEVPPTFEEIAVRIVDLIRSVQPTGPYRLGGFCNGALAMYEVAQQLTRAGETVSALVLLDPPDLYLFLLRRRVAEIGARFGLSEARFRPQYQRIAEGIEVWQYYGPFRLVKDFFDRIFHFGLKIFRHFFVPKKDAAPQEPAGMKLNFDYYQVMGRYEPKTYVGSGQVWIILREGEGDRCPRQFSYWNGFVPDSIFEVVPGTHLELKSSMKEIAAIIKTALNEAG
jgi:amino acid adenylation domain-containing protein